MDQILDYGFGIVMMLGFIGFICLKSRKRASVRNDDEYWADRQDEYDAPVIVGYGSDDSDSDSGSDDD